MRSSLLSLVVAALTSGGAAFAQSPNDFPPPDLPDTGPDGLPAPPGSPRRMVRDARERAAQPADPDRVRAGKPAFIRSWSA